MRSTIPPRALSRGSAGQPAYERPIINQTFGATCVIVRDNGVHQSVWYLERFTIERLDLSGRWRHSKLCTLRLEALLSTKTRLPNMMARHHLYDSNRRGLIFGRQDMWVTITGGTEYV